MTVDLTGRSLLTWLDYSSAEIEFLLAAAKTLKREKTPHRRFAGVCVALLFEKRSTRTRCAFETALGEEGGHPVFLSTDDIQLGAKESIEDTARTLGRMFNAIQFRGFSQSAVETLAACSGVPVYNGLTDLYHPTQVLADMLTLEENLGACRGTSLCFVGDGRNNVARSLMVICAKLGVHFTVICPRALEPDAALISRCAADFAASNAKCLVTDDANALAGADAVYTDVWTSMGEEAQAPTRRALLAPYQVNDELFAKTGNSQAIFLHCLPAVRGEEVSAAVIDGPRSRVWDEAENRKHTIKAIMLATLGRL